MTTIAQVRRILRPLLDRHPDLALVGRQVIFTPVRHLLRGVVIDATRSANVFCPHRAAIFLFDVKSTFSLSWGKRLYRRSGLWNLDDPKTADDICEMIESDALPVLRAIETIDDFIAYTRDEQLSQNSIDQHPLAHAILQVARGDLKKANAICASLDDAKSREWFNLLAPYDYARVMHVMPPLIEQEDRIGLARLLHEWEAASVRNLRLEKFWAPSPFPVESI